MSKLTYGVIMSLDGYVADAAGSFAWGVPDAQVHAFVNDLQRSVGTYLYGRRLYEVMAPWENDRSLAEQAPHTAQFARLWQGADKIVYSATLPQPLTARTRIERSFDAEAVRALKVGAGDDLTIGGPTLAAAALRAGLVDDVYVFVSPVIVGAGLRAFPGDVPLALRLTDERAFPGRGMVFARYAVEASHVPASPAAGGEALDVLADPARPDPDRPDSWR